MAGLEAGRRPLWACTLPGSHRPGRAHEAPAQALPPVVVWSALGSVGRVGDGGVCVASCEVGVLVGCVRRVTNAARSGRVGRRRRDAASARVMVSRVGDVEEPVRLHCPRARPGSPDFGESHGVGRFAHGGDLAAEVGLAVCVVVEWHRDGEAHDCVFLGLALTNDD